MQIAKLGVVAAVLMGAIIALLWATGAVTPDQVGRIAIAAFAGLLILILAAFALKSLRGPAHADQTDRPVP